MTNVKISELLFYPSEKIQNIMKEKLDDINPNHFLFERKYPKDTQIRIKISSLIGVIDGFYNLGSRKHITDLFKVNLFANVYLDGVKNAFEHGPKNFPLIAYGLFLGDKALCHGFKDFGDYFKKEETKKKWESGERILSRKTSGPRNNGTDWILRPRDKKLTLVDYFEVDVNQGALFCVQSLDKLEINLGKNFYYLLE